MTNTLRSIEEDIQALEDLLIEMGGDISDIEAEQAIDAWLEENKKNLQKKLDGYGTIIKSRLGLAAARKEEAQRLAAMAKTDENIVAKLKDRLMYFMNSQSVGKKIETTLHKFSIQANGGRAPVVMDTSVKTPEAEFITNATIEADDGTEYVVQDFIRVSYSWDLEYIREVIERHGGLPIAHIGERGEHLRVR